MIFIVFLVFAFGKKLSLNGRMTLQEALAGLPLDNVKPFIHRVLLITAIFEILGTFVLTASWLHHFPFRKALYAGLFHSISGFCTAGFSIFADSFIKYKSAPIINLSVAVISIIGGLGFFVLNDIYVYFCKLFKRERPIRLSVHSKVVLTITPILIILGTIGLFFFEKELANLSFNDRVLISSFQSISAATTTGFNTVDIGTMNPVGLLIIVILMFIGASPGGTGGGIKTTSFFVIILYLVAHLKGREQINIFRRQLHNESINKAVAVGIMAIVVLALGVILLMITERAPFLNTLFEAMSAIGTVGLSMGMTPSLTNAGKLVICILMFFGRIGPLSIGFALMGGTDKPSYSLPKEKVYVG